MDLKTPIKEAGRVYKMYARRLEKLGIQIIEDFLYHIPFRYEDYSLVSKVKDVQPGEIVTIQGTIAEIKNQYTRRFRTIQRAKVEDETGVIDVTWFNQPFLLKTLRVGEKVSLSGKTELFGKKPVLQSPEYEIMTQKDAEPNTEQRGIHTGRLVPVYPETRGVSSKWLRRQIATILQNQTQNIFEYIPDSIISVHNLLELQNAIRQIHFPNSLDLAKKARQRLAFNELFLIHLAVLKRREAWKKNLKGNPFSISKFKKNIQKFWEKLPFTLTNAQKRAVKEIFADLAAKKPMNRLLEGDVGSGKTVVSAIAMYLAHLNGFQSALMAPTEILAHQHFNTINNLLKPLGVKVALSTGSIKYKVSSIKYAKNKKIHNTKYIIQNTDILVGTHALLSQKINFERLGLVVIDEQQRFGVEQRAIIRAKGKNPHLLTMTATPIPRTVALTLYGDLDLSYLDEMPKGRRIVKTWLVPPHKREGAYGWIKSQLSTFNSQLFIICPFIEESESLQTVKAATTEFNRLKKDVFPNLTLGLLHGKLKRKEKERVLQEFRNGKIDILVATPVVEVGIDIPNATIILIEASERFGLAQLHQLRGRVGRGEKQSYCLLFTESKSQYSHKRLKAMETMYVGAELAELDLKLRGAGELYGTKQHGQEELKIASFSDFKLIEITKREAEKIFPKLSEYPLLLQKVQMITRKTVAPD